MIAKKPLCPQRICKIISSFAFIEHRFLRNGFWEALSHYELLLYIFLILVADRKGLSYYSYDNICTLLRISVDEYIITRNALIENQTPLSLKNPRKLKMKGVDRDKEKNY